MKICSNNISHVAELARLELNDEERAEFSKQLSEVIEYVEKIGQLDTESVKPADHIINIHNIFRKDGKPSESLDRDEIKKIAPDFERGGFIVPRIIEDK